MMKRRRSPLFNQVNEGTFFDLGMTLEMIEPRKSSNSSALGITLALDMLLDSSYKVKDIEVLDGVVCMCSSKTEADFFLLLLKDIGSEC
jgi:hypothetical protein